MNRNWNRREFLQKTSAATADERPCKTIEKPIRIDQIHQTIYHALGMPEDTNYVVEKRPFYTTPDGKGKAEMELFA